MGNILDHDQHFAVRLNTIPKESKDSDHSDNDEVKVVNEFDDCSPPHDMVQAPAEKLYIYLFSLAIYDSKKIIEKDIRRRRAQITERREREAAMEAKQDKVAASSIKPNDAVRMLGNWFCEHDKQPANQNKRLDALEEAQAKLGTSTAKEDITIKLNPTDSDITSEAGKQAEDNWLY